MHSVELISNVAAVCDDLVICDYSSECCDTQTLSTAFEVHLLSKITPNEIGCATLIQKH